MIEMEVNQKVGLKIAKSFWIKLARKTLTSVRFKKTVKISLALVGEKEIKKYNKVYRKIDKVTDVLSFAEEKSDVIFPQDKGYLGEILICYPKAKKQAKLNQKSLADELSLLFVHGLLHLLGYDHKRKNQADLMHKLEGKIISK